jgi:hypothetical protein
MPKVKPLIPDALVLEKLDVLSGDIQLIPPQVEMILGVGAEQLKDNRKEGRPPKFVMEGGAIRYRVEDVRKYLRDKKVLSNTAESFVEKLRIQRDFSAFMSEATLDDQYPFTIVNGKPIDFFESLGIQLDDETRCDWLSLKDYCRIRIDNETKKSTATPRSTPQFPSLLPFASFAHFMTSAGREDTWPFLVVDHKPVDLFGSLSMPVDEYEAYGENLTLEQYCEERVSAEHLRIADAEAKELQELLKGKDFPEGTRETV